MMVSDFIKTLGGAAEVARKTPYSAEAVRMWGHRKKIPSDAWFDLMEAYPGKVTLETRKHIESVRQTQTA